MYTYNNICKVNSRQVLSQYDRVITTCLILDCWPMNLYMQCKSHEQLSWMTYNPFVSCYGLRNCTWMGKPRITSLEKSSEKRKDGRAEDTSRNEEGRGRKETRMKETKRKMDWTDIICDITYIRQRLRIQVIMYM